LHSKSRRSRKNAENHAFEKQNSSRARVFTSGNKDHGLDVWRDDSVANQFGSARRDARRDRDSMSRPEFWKKQREIPRHETRMGVGKRAHRDNCVIVAIADHDRERIMAAKILESRDGIYGFGAYVHFGLPLYLLARFPLLLREEAFSRGQSSQMLVNCVVFKGSIDRAIADRVAWTHFKSFIKR
jgi:hypothetical protein